MMDQPVRGVRPSRAALIRVGVALTVLAYLAIFDVVSAGGLQQALNSASSVPDANSQTLNDYTSSAGNNILLEDSMHKMYVAVWSMYAAIAAWIACAALLIKGRASTRAAAAMAVLMSLALTAQFVAGYMMHGDDVPIPNAFIILAFFYPIIVALAAPTLRLAVYPLKRLGRTAGLGAVAVLAFLLVVGLSGQKIAAQLAVVEARPADCNSNGVSSALVTKIHQDATDADRADTKAAIDKCIAWADATGDNQIIEHFKAFDATNLTPTKTGVLTVLDLQQTPTCSGQTLSDALADSKTAGEVKGDASDRRYVVAKLWEAKVYAQCGNDAGGTHLSKAVEDMVGASSALEDAFTIAVNSNEPDLAAEGCLAAQKARTMYVQMAKLTPLMDNDQLAQFLQQHDARAANVLMLNCGMAR